MSTKIKSTQPGPLTQAKDEYVSALKHEIKSTQAQLVELERQSMALRLQVEFNARQMGYLAGRLELAGKALDALPKDSRSGS